MKRLLLILPLALLCGCVGIVHELERGNLAIVHHTRGAGFDANVPVSTDGSTTIRLRFGWFSDTTTILPCSTNKLNAVAVADTHRVTTTAGVTTGVKTEIIEDMASGYEGAPPTPRHAELFSPKAKP